MNQYLEEMYKRRSNRFYSGKAISEETLNEILEAGLLSPTGRNLQSNEFIVVKDKEILEKISVSRDMGARHAASADVVIVVIGDKEKSDTWIEDAVLSIGAMHYYASSQNIASCIVQGRNRYKDGKKMNDILKELLHYPDHFELEGLLVLGMPSKELKPHTKEELKTSRIHREKF